MKALLLLGPLAKLLLLALALDALLLLLHHFLFGLALRPLLLDLLQLELVSAPPLALYPPLLLSGNALLLQRL